MSLFPTPQSTLDFPQPLSEKYRPRTIAEFIGLEKQKTVSELSEYYCFCNLTTLVQERILATHAGSDSSRRGE